MGPKLAEAEDTGNKDGEKLNCKATGAPGAHVSGCLRVEAAQHGLRDFGREPVYAGLRGWR